MSDSSDRGPDGKRPVYAHSLPGRPQSEWETLSAHLRAVADAAGRMADVFGWGAIVHLAALLHDIGKCSQKFQTYISAETDESQRGPDHSTAGAREVMALLKLALPPGMSNFERLLAFVIAGHHAGLADWKDLEPRLARELPPYDGWRSHAQPLPSSFAPTRRFKPGAEPGFTFAFLTRMLFSCLVDADRLETAGFYAEAEGRSLPPPGYTPIPILRDRLRAFMTRKAAEATARAQTETQRRLNALRQRILAHADAKAELPPGFFTLTVPTGGGKTLASLSFALEHAARHGLRRVVLVIPFTSIIEQSAGVFREALGESDARMNEGDILEHHATFDWEAALDKAASKEVREDGRGTGLVEQLQRAAENWDVPIVVTTAVQFFESLFASRPSACRKLHNLANSVIVLDEAQTLPLRILRPCLAALDELARNYGASIVLCTATQPAWRKQDGKLIVDRNTRAERNVGLDIPPERELAPDPDAVFEALKRVTVERLAEPIADEVIAARFAEQPRMLCIVNSRRHAKVLFERIKGLDGAIHLSTWMCPKHRRLVLERARADLRNGKPVRIVSTSLIEAGVDIDFPEVWRAAAGLDNILQAAGRCNREFLLEAGRLVIFESLDAKAPHDLEQAWQACREALMAYASDPQSPAAIRAFFGMRYFTIGDKALDASKLGSGRDAKPFPILAEIGDRAKECAFPFKSIAEAFKVIDDVMEPVVVPWSSGPGDSEAEDLLAAIATMEKPSRTLLRKLQQYTVSIPREQRDAWLQQRVLRAVHPALGMLLRFDDLALYDARSGLRVGEPEMRSAENNVM